MDKKKLQRIACVGLCALLTFAVGCSGAPDETYVKNSDVGGKTPHVVVTPGANEVEISKKEELTESQTYAPKYTFDYLGDDVMPKGAWNTPPYSSIASDNYLKAEYFQAYAEAGLNFMPDYFMNAQSPEVSTAIKLAEQNGLVYLSGDANKHAGIGDVAMVKTNLQRVSSAPNFGGVLAVDEPGFDDFPLLGQVHTAYKTAYKDMMMFINLLGISTSDVSKYKEGFSGANVDPVKYDYRTDYVDKYVEQVSPEVLVYDYYPCVGKFPAVQPDYFNNLSEISDAARENDIPFWPYIQLCSWNTASRICTQAEISWQVNCALAYGAKGLMYFMFWTPPDNPGEQYTGCMISRQGEKQDTYYSVQNVNASVQAVEMYLLNSRFQGVICVGESPAAIPAREQLTTYGTYKNSVGVPHITGCFDYMGKDAYYMVCNSIEKGGTVRMNFDADKEYTVIYRGVEYKTNGLMSFDVNAGEGVLIIENEE